MKEEKEKRRFIERKKGEEKRNGLMREDIVTFLLREGKD